MVMVMVMIMILYCTVLYSTACEFYNILPVLKLDPIPRPFIRTIMLEGYLNTREDGHVLPMPPALLDAFLPPSLDQAAQNSQVRSVESVPVFYKCVSGERKLCPV